ncbi:MAG: AEC family transporter [Pseudomonadota bacterium]
MNALSTTLPALYATIAPIFFVVAAGFAVRKGGVLTADGFRTLAAYVATVAAPAMVFHAIATSAPGALGQPGYLAGYTLGSMGAFVLCYAGLRWATHTRGPVLAFGALGGSFGNSLMVGYPLAVLLYGEAASIALALTLLVEVAVVLPMALTLADVGRPRAPGERHPAAVNALAIARNPLFGAMVLGALVAWGELRLPQPVDDGLALLARTVAPVGLFVIGGLIVGYTAAGDGRRQAIVVPGKLLVHPVAVCLALLAFGVTDPALIGPALCFAASPIFGAYAAISQRYGIARESAAVMIATTVCAAATLPLVLWLIGAALTTP